MAASSEICMTSQEVGLTHRILWCFSHLHALILGDITKPGDAFIAASCLISMLPKNPVYWSTLSLFPYWKCCFKFFGIILNEIFFSFRFPFCCSFVTLSWDLSHDRELGSVEVTAFTFSFLSAGYKYYLRNAESAHSVQTISQFGPYLCISFYQFRFMAKYLLSLQFELIPYILNWRLISVSKVSELVTIFN